MELYMLHGKRKCGLGLIVIQDDGYLKKEIMKFSGFRKQTPEELQEKQAVKRAKFFSETAKQARQQKLQEKRVAVANLPKKRKKKTGVQKMRKACDDLLTPIIKKMYPHCLLTGEPTEVAHHHIKKSESSSLRYYIPNLIPLTHKAHMALHSHETIYSSKIVAIKGLDWWEDIERVKRMEVKTNLQFYIENHKRLTDILESL